MSSRVTLHESAEVELNEAADFYDLESPGLGTLFIDEVERTLATLAEFPGDTPPIKTGRPGGRHSGRFTADVLGLSALRLVHVLMTTAGQDRR